LRAIVEHLKGLSEKTLVLVLTPPPVNEEALGQALRGGARRCGLTSGLLAQDEAAQHALACARYVRISTAFSKQCVDFPEGLLVGN
jgi:hypothetical protein